MANEKAPATDQLAEKLHKKSELTTLADRILDQRKHPSDKKHVAIVKDGDHGVVVSLSRTRKSRDTDSAGYEFAMDPRDGSWSRQVVWGTGDDELVHARGIHTDGNPYDYELGPEKVVEFADELGAAMSPSDNPFFAERSPVLIESRSAALGRAGVKLASHLIKKL